MIIPLRRLKLAEGDQKPRVRQGALGEILAAEPANPTTPISSNCQPSLLRREHVGQGALQPVHDLLERLEGDALLSIFKTEQARRRDSELSGESRIGGFSPSFAEKNRKLMVQRLPHGERLNDLAFLMRNVFR